MAHIHKSRTPGGADAPRAGNVSIYKVKFDAMGGSNAPPAQYVLSSTKQPEVTPVREGYTFAGWVTPDGKAWDFASPVTGKINLPASWTPDTSEGEVQPGYVKIHFHSPDTDVHIPDQTVPIGGTIKKPADPVFEGFQFLGWYDILGNKLDLDAAAQRDFSLFALFNAKIFSGEELSITGRNFDLNVDQFTFHKGASFAVYESWMTILTINNLILLDDANTRPPGDSTFVRPAPSDTPTDYQIRIFGTDGKEGPSMYAPMQAAPGKNGSDSVCADCTPCQAGGDGTPGGTSSVTALNGTEGLSLFNPDISIRNIAGNGTVVVTA
jgi:uncharacterized repeat protein (TIGR02543 family)